MNTWVALPEILRNLALAVAAFVGAILAWWQLSPAALQARSADTQAELARRSHVTEPFNRAVGQLSGPKLEVRLAAVYLRAGDIDYGDDAPPIDVQEIMKLLRDRFGET